MICLLLILMLVVTIVLVAVSDFLSKRKHLVLTHIVVALLDFAVD
jgi:hypothetical protein